jgi:hypothetical protein
MGSEIGIIQETQLLKSLTINQIVKTIGKSSQVTVLNYEKNIGYSYLHV